jgi:hypothetical protein
MSLETARARFEQRQVDLFRDECVVTRLSGEPTFDPGTGLMTSGTTTTVYDGPCLLRSFTWEGTDVQFGEVEIRLRRVRAKFPKDTDLERDDIVTPTASTHDDSLVGRAYRVTDVFRDGWQICRVAICETIE